MNKMWLIIGMVAVSACATSAADDSQRVSTGQTNEDVLVLRRDGSRMVDQGSAGRIAGHEMVCRVEATTGSRIRKTQCRTQAEWEAIAREGRRFMELRQTGTADSN